MPALTLSCAIRSRSSAEVRRGTRLALVLGVLEQAGRGGQIDDLLRLHRHRDRHRRLVGVDIVGLAGGIGADRRDDRRQALVEQAVQPLGADVSDVADEAERRDRAAS